MIPGSGSCCNEYLKMWKKEIFAICDNMDGPKDTMLSKINQRKTSTIWSHLHVKSRKQNKWTTKPKEKQNDTYGTDWCLGEGKEWEVGQNRWSGLRNINTNF